MLRNCKTCNREFIALTAEIKRGKAIYCSIACRSNKNGTQSERFWRKVTKTESCWIWFGRKDRDGYGIAGWTELPHAYKAKKAHRLAYEIIVGKIPDGLTLDHLCRVRHCVNPEHLEPVTNRENRLRGNGLAAINARKFHCIRGHELSGDNLRIYTGSNGNVARGCRACQRIADNRYRQLLKARNAQRLQPAWS